MKKHDNNVLERDVVAKRIDGVSLERGPGGHLFAYSRGGSGSRYRITMRPDGALFCECPSWRNDNFRVDRIVRREKDEEGNFTRREYRASHQRVCKHTVKALEEDETPLTTSGVAPKRSTVKKTAKVLDKKAVQCEGETQAKARCRRMIAEGEDYCTLHVSQRPKPRPKRRGGARKGVSS